MSHVVLVLHGLSDRKCWPVFVLISRNQDVMDVHNRGRSRESRRNGHTKRGSVESLTSIG